MNFEEFDKEVQQAVSDEEVYPDTTHFGVSDIITDLVDGLTEEDRLNIILTEPSKEILGTNISGAPVEYFSDAIRYTVEFFFLDKYRR